MGVNTFCLAAFIFLVFIPFFAGYFYSIVYDELQEDAEYEGDDSFATMAMYQSYDS